jgi:hypothetical protein
MLRRLTIFVFLALLIVPTAGFAAPSGGAAGSPAPAGDVLDDLRPDRSAGVDPDGIASGAERCLFDRFRAR